MFPLAAASTSAALYPRRYENHRRGSFFWPSSPTATDAAEHNNQHESMSRAGHHTERLVSFPNCQRTMSAAEPP